MENTENIEAKDRIINASIELFSQKGFDAASVNEIAEQANVTKALIYYYFKSKEEILDCLVVSLMDDITALAMDFIHTNIVRMIKEGRLDIEPDRLHFVNEEAVRQFLKNVEGYSAKILDYAIVNRDVIRILMLESLKNSKYHNELFRLLNLSKSGDDNPVFKTIYDADRDFNYSDDMVLFKFFFSLLPVINFAVYYDDYRNISSLSDEEMRNSFLRSFRLIADSLISGNDILLRNNEETTM